VAATAGRDRAYVNANASWIDQMHTYISLWTTVHASDESSRRLRIREFDHIELVFSN